MAITGDNSSYRSNFRRHITKTLMQEFDIGSENQYFLFIAGVSGPTAGQAPLTTTDSREEEINTWRDILAVKSIDIGQSFDMIAKTTWTSGVTYAMYDDTVDLVDKNYFVMNDTYDVYKCLDNNNNKPSVEKPIGTKTEGNTKTADGFVWKYMYTVPASHRTFITDNYIPVRIQKASGVFTESKNQWLVQQNAKDGGIEIVLSETATNFANAQVIPRDNPYATTSVVAKKEGSTLYLNEQHSLSDDAYNDYTVMILSGPGAGQRRKITDYDGTLNFITVDAPWDKTINSGSQYEIAPQLVIYGDGSSAEGFINLTPYNASSATSKTIDSVSISNAGKNYTTSSFELKPAGVTSSNATPWSFRTIHSPKGGHGSNAIHELDSRQMLIVLNVDANEGSSGGNTAEGFYATNDVRQYGILKNPILNDTDSTYLKSDGTPYRIAGQATNISRYLDIVSATEDTFLAENLFIPGRHIIGKETKSTARIVSWGPGLSTRHGLLKIDNVKGFFREPADAASYGEGIAEFTQEEDEWSITHSGYAKVAGFDEVIQANSPTYRCTTIVGVSGSSLNTASFVLDGGVTGGLVSTGATGAPTGTVVSWEPSSSGLSGELILSGTKGTFNVGDYIGSAFASSTTSVIHSLTGPELLPHSGEIIYLQSMKPIERGPEQREQYQLLFGF